ncbi:MAG: sugar phosphate isomerase/epimerase [Planctomycetes bacterium]|nr:sugar phosphate isomerase/epimerase [Planctomycetota bacterium]
MKFAICNEFCENWNLSHVFKLAADIGYDGVEIAPFTIADSVSNISMQKRKNIKNLAVRYGIEIIGLHWLFVGPKGLSITSPDYEVRKRTREYFLALIDICADLGGTTMVIGSPKQRNIPEGETFKSAWRFAKNMFLECLPLAEKRGVVLLIEPLSPAETNFINTAKEAIRLIEEINSPNFKLVLDVKAMSSENAPIPEIIMHSAMHLYHFHANDANKRGPGFGDIDFRPIIKALDKIKYKRYVSVEVFDFKPDPVTIARKSCSYLKECLK